MLRRVAVARRSRPRAASLIPEALESRQFLSAVIAGGSDDGSLETFAIHGAGCACGVCSGERYVEPKNKPQDGKAPKLGKTLVPVASDTPPADEGTVDFDIPESGSNNTPGTAQPITLGPTNLVIDGSVSPSGDLDYFSFTLAQRSGVFFDVDSRDTGLSTTLNSLITLYDNSGTTQVASNDNGDDFEDFALNDTTSTARSFDSSLYVDLNAGSYFVRVSGVSSTTGTYEFKVRADTNYSSGIPVFNSLPGATDTLFLDFDGHSSSTDSWATRDIDPNTAGVQANGPYAIQPFDFSGNAGEWTPGERAAIENVWRVVAEDYAPFNINVTTSYAGTFNDGIGHRQVIGNSDGTEVNVAGSLGVAFRPSYAVNGSNGNVAFTFANSFSSFVGSGGNTAQIGAKAVEMGNTTSHEFGHALGLQHYANPQTPVLPNTQENGIMATPDFGLNRERWKAGPTKSDESPVNPSQVDVDIISSTSTAGGLPNNTFGYRADDHGNTRPAATAMSGSGGTFSGQGFIGQKTDVDFFSFTTTGGSTTVSVSMLERVANLDAELYLYNSAGTLLASSDLTTTILAGVTQNLAAGTYYAEVRSDGEEGEIGQYAVNVSTLADTTAPTADVVNVSPDPRTNGVSSVTVTFSEAVTGFTLGDITLTRNGSPLAFSGSEAPTTSDNITWTIPNLLGATSTSGTYVLTVVASGSGIIDGAGNALAANADDTWVHSLPAWLTASGTAATWNSFSKTLSVTGSAMITADPGADAPLVTANGAAAVLTISPPAGAVVSLGGLSVSNNASAVLSAAGAARTLVVGAGTPPVGAVPLSVGTGGKFDLTDNAMVVEGGTLTAVKNMITAGYNGGTWDGTGLFSRTASTDPNADTGIGYVDNSELQATTFAGATGLNGNEILVKYTYYGDADLTGVVDTDDFQLFLAGYQDSTLPRTWFYGDFDYTGVIDTDDFQVFLYGYQNQGPPLA